MQTWTPGVVRRLLRAARSVPGHPPVQWLHCSCAERLAPACFCSMPGFSPLGLELSFRPWDPAGFSVTASGLCSRVTFSGRLSPNTEHGTSCSPDPGSSHLPPSRARGTRWVLMSAPLTGASALRGWDGLSVLSTAVVPDARPVPGPQWVLGKHMSTEECVGLGRRVEAGVRGYLVPIKPDDSLWSFKPWTCGGWRAAKSAKARSVCLYIEILLNGFSALSFR